jgi:hypothetical protein
MTRTREQQIEEALVFSPPHHDRDECRHEIELMLDQVERRTTTATAHKVFGSEKGKASLERFGKALRDVRAAYDALDPTIRPWFSLAETAYVAGQPTFIDREISKVERLLARPSRPPKRDDARKLKEAVATAHSLTRSASR